MSPRTPQQNEIIRRQKREQIMEAALQVFAQKGYHSASMNQVAQAAKISKGLSYSYFESKEDLLKAILMQGFEELDGFSQAFPEGLSSDEMMGKMLDYYIAAVKKNPDYWKLYFSLLMQLNLQDIFGKELEEIYGRLLMQFVLFFEKKGCEDPTSEALLLGAMLDGVFMNYLMNPEFFDLQKIKTIILKRFL